VDPKTLAGLQAMADAANQATRTAGFAQSLAASSAVARIIEQASAFQVPAAPAFEVSAPDLLGGTIAQILDQHAASTARLLDAVGPVVNQAPLGLDFENVIGPLRATLDTIATINLDRFKAPLEALWARWDQRLVELAPEKRRVVAYLAERGWHQNFAMPWWDEELLRLVDAGDATGVDAYIADMVEESLDELVANVAAEFPARTVTVTQARRAHADGLFDLSVLAALSLADGVTQEVLGVPAFGKDHGKPRTAPFAEDRIARAGAGTGAAVDWLLIDLIPLQAGSTLLISTTDRDARRTADPAFGPLNRHGVLHGLDVGFGTRENSLRAFAALGYFVGLRELLDLPSNTLGQP
jgi:hypothetical protein